MFSNISAYNVKQTIWKSRKEIINVAPLNIKLGDVIHINDKYRPFTKHLFVTKKGICYSSGKRVSKHIIKMYKMNHSLEEVKITINSTSV